MERGLERETEHERDGLTSGLTLSFCWICSANRLKRSS